MLRRGCGADGDRRAGAAAGSNRRRPDPLNSDDQSRSETPPQGIIGFSRRPTRREWRRAGITFVAGIVLLFLVVALVHPQPPVLATGSAAPPIRLHAIDGSSDTLLPRHDGRAVLLVFFQASCATCGSAMQPLCHLAATDSHASVAAIDAGNDDASSMRAFSGRYLPAGCPLPLLLDPGLAVSRAYGIAVVPTAYVIDAQGRIHFGAYGSAGVGDAAADVQRIAGG